MSSVPPDVLFPGAAVDADALALLLADKRSPGTRKAYAADLRDFFHRAYAVAEPTPAAVAAFLGLPALQVALHLAAYKAELLRRGLFEATVDRRLAAVRSLLAFCHRLGRAASDGRGLVRSEKNRAYRDTRGIDEASLRRLVALPGTDTLRGLRDTALLRLLGESALRRAEVCSCTVSSFSATDCRLLILGKGRGTQKEPVTLAPRCATAIAAYLEAAGHGREPDGPLFRNVDPRPAVRGRGLTVDGLYDIVRRYGYRLGLPLSCHKLRHTGPRPVPASIETAEQLQLLTDNVTDYAVFLADTSGQKITWNVGVERITGYTEAEFLGRPPDLLFTRKTVRRAFPRDARRGGGGRAEDERWHLRKDGSRYGR